MGLGLASGNNLVADFLGERDVNQPIAVNVTKFSPAQPELETTEAVRKNLYVRQAGHGIADSLLRFSYALAPHAVDFNPDEQKRKRAILVDIAARLSWLGLIPAAQTVLVQEWNDARMSAIAIRAATRADVPRLTQIYNHYVLNTPVTFDVEPYTAERRMAWFEQFSATGRYRLLVAEEQEHVTGYAGTTRFRVKPAYETTVETTIYCAPESVGRGLGRRLYSALFEAIRDEDIHRIVGGYTLPNRGSEALHERFGFVPVGIFRENGRKFGRYWDVAWTERPLHLKASSD